MAESAGTLADVLASRRQSRFVGRASEIELFRQALEAAEPLFSVLFIHGPGGIGKTSLLDVLAGLSAEAGAQVKRVDARELAPTPDAVLGALGDVRAVGDTGDRVVVLIDTYERIAALDDWVRTHLVPRLPATALTVLAGRAAPGHGWRADPAWRDVLRVVSLRNLSPEDSRSYLERSGVSADLHDRLLEISHGHPLGLSLLADVAVRSADAAVEEAGNALPPDLVGTLVRQFVDVVPTDSQRRALEVFALARVTTEALLRDALELGDAHELFAWLRELSFMESGRDGIWPHDLARDVLDVDLRWRDRDGYKRTFRRVREHTHSRLATTRGKDQQRAIFDEKYLFRNLPSILAPVDWQTFGMHYPEPAQPGDHDQIVDLVVQWEGDESAAIAKRWLGVQPEGFFVLRRDAGTVGGFLGLLDLSAASAEDREADPIARMAWHQAWQRMPPRHGEVVLQARFVIDRDAYQGPSATMNAAPILNIQREIQTPNLSWDFLALADPDQWDPYFAVADIARVAGADVEVGGRRYGLFAHDFRQVPVDAWLELVTERALEQDFTLPPAHPAESLVLSAEDFADAARQALRDMRRPDLLGRNSLLRTRLLRDRAEDGEPDAVDLEALLSDAIDSLAEHPRDDKLFRAVDRTYVRPAGTQEAAAEALGVPFSSYRRHLTQGVDRVVAWLWDRELYGTDR